MSDGTQEFIDAGVLTLQEWVAGFVTFLPELIVALVIFVIGLYLAALFSRLVTRRMKRRGADPETTILMGHITRWAIFILALITALQQVGFNVTAFLAGLGILGLTVGFALQDVSKNFVAGLLLLIQQPFDVGNIIEVGGYTGVVLDVNLRATEIKTFDGVRVLIPNSDVITSAIKNFSRENTRRFDITMGVAYGSDLDEVKAISVESILEIEGILSDPEPMVVYNNFGGSSIDFTLYYWVNLDEISGLQAVDAVVTHINTAFEKANIDIPFPTQNVILQPQS